MLNFESWDVWTLISMKVEIYETWDAWKSIFMKVGMRMKVDIDETRDSRQSQRKFTCSVKYVHFARNILHNASYFKGCLRQNALHPLPHPRHATDLSLKTQHSTLLVNAMGLRFMKLEIFEHWDLWTLIFLIIEISMRIVMFECVNSPLWAMLFLEGVCA